MSRARTAHEAAMVFDRRSLAEHETRDALEGLALDHRRMADVIERTGPPSATVASVEEAIALRRRLLAADPGSIDDRWELGYDLGELG